MLRALSAHGWAAWEFVRSRPFFEREMAAGRIVRTEEIPPPAPPVAPEGPWVGWLRHERIPRISYPYEWSFGMLRDAALLTLDLMHAALADGAILKDASPFNVQFVGARPVFIDVASFVPHQGGPWEGYRQFCQMFLYPLLLQAWRNIDFQPWLRGRLAGITPEECWRMLSLRDLFRRGALTHVFLHAKLSHQVGESQRSIPDSMRESGFQSQLIEANVTKLRRIVAGLRWGAKSSYWSDYDRASRPAPIDGPAKEAFVARIAAQRRWGEVWDLGCHLGRYARIVAPQADRVTAIDNDHLSVDRMYESLKGTAETGILPLVFNVTDPSPAMGWRGRERLDLVGRGRPDLVLCLALIHHLVLRENLRLEDVMDWLAELRAALVIEFVDKSDPQAQSLLAHRADQYDDYSAESFETLLTSRFHVHERQPLPSHTRTLYFAVPRE